MRACPSCGMPATSMQSASDDPPWLGPMCSRCGWFGKARYTLTDYGREAVEEIRRERKEEGAAP